MEAGMATGTTHTGLDQTVDLLFSDAGLNANLTAEQLNAGAASADAMNLLIVEAVMATGVANDGQITTSDVYTLNRYIRSHHLDSWTALYGDNSMSGEIGFQNVHWDGAESSLYDQNAVDTVMDAIYHLGFQIDDGRFEGSWVALDDVAFWLNELLGPELAAGTLANPHADPQFHGTTGTGLDALVDTIENDTGLNDNLSQRQINDGAAAADAMNALIVEGIKATGIADDGDLTALDVVDLGHWIAAHHLAEWTGLHGNDENGHETGFHLVENDGSRAYLYFEDAVDTIAEGIYDLGFGTQWDRFKNEDGNANERISDVSDWLTLLLQKDLADGSLASGHPPVDPASLTGDIAYKHLAPVSDNGDTGALDLGRPAAMQLQNGTIAFQFLANAPGDGGYHVLFAKDAASDGAGDVTAFLHDGHVTVLVQDGTQDHWIDAGDVTIEAGRQYDFAMSFGSDGIQIYINGEKVAAEYDIHIGLDTNNRSLILGGGDWDRDGSHPDTISNHLDGTISNFTVYDRALTSDEVHAIGTSGPLDHVEAGAAVRDGAQPAVLAGTGLVGEVFDRDATFSSIDDLIAQTVLSPADHHFTASKIAFDGFQESPSPTLRLFFDGSATLSDGGEDTAMNTIGLHMHGFIWIGAGDHLVSVRSDDGFLLSLGGNVISGFSGDRGFEATSQQVHFTGGLYAIDLYYFQNAGANGLRLEIDGKTVGPDAFFASAEDYDAALTANGPMPDGGIPHPYDGPVGTTGTHLDDLITIIGMDQGLANNVSHGQMLGGAAAANETNKLILEALDATGIYTDGHLSVDDIYVLQDWIRVNRYQEFVQAHGDDDQDLEYGMHLVQNNGATTQLFGENAVDNVIDGIGHLCFQIVNGRFLNEDGNANERVETMAFWLNEILSGGALGAPGTGPDGGVGDAAHPDVVEDTALNTRLAAGALNLTLKGTAANGTGNDLANKIIGNAFANTLDGGNGNDNLVGGDGDDVLTGGGGADEMQGGKGNDTYSVDDAGDHISESGKATGGNDTVLVSGALTAYTLGAGVENLIFNGSADFQATGNKAANEIATGAGNDTLNGAEGNDTLEAGAGDDNLVGGAGNDWLDGGAGADHMAGGIGNDSYVVDNKNDVIVEKAGEGTDTVYAEFTYSLGGTLENLVLTGGGSINGTGNALDNHLTGNWANNVLNGGAGADRMEGQGGNDIYIVDNVDDKAIESDNNGHDTVRTSVDFTLGRYVEDGVLLGTANLSLTGSAADNKLTGNGGNNALSGAGGIDWIYGGDGDDTVSGGTGGDTLRGGTGADTFVYAAANDSLTTARDSILDFSHAEGDKIDLRLIDAVTGGGDNAFHLVAALSGHAGELAVTAQGGHWLVSGDVDGDGVADFAISVTSSTALVGQDFLL
jgi:Ca2+-binding RTX toxin-like protein